MDEFEAIRPYADAEVPLVMARLFADREFLDILAHFRFPRLADSLGWLIKPVISQRLRKQFASIHTVDALQHKIEAYIDRTIERAKKAIEENGLNWRSFQNSPEGREKAHSDDWMVRGWPTIVILDADFKIRYRGHDGDAATKVAKELVAKMTKIEG